MMPHGELTVEIKLERASADRNRACHGCDKVTATVVNIVGLGQVLATVPICDVCQDALAASGISIDSAQNRTVDELMAGGMSERLARLVARRWTR
jgi:hypothetical protein